jgi:hypothetical protein
MAVYPYTAKIIKNTLNLLTSVAMLMDSYKFKSSKKGFLNV